MHTIYMSDGIVGNVYGYLRVSTEKQNIENNKSSILNYANDNKLGSVTWIQETVTGRKQWQNRKLGEKFETMQRGDVIICAEFSRIGRDMLNSLEFVSLARKRGIRVISISGDIPESDTATSNLLLCMSAWKNQMEREVLAERTRVGLQCAKEKGVKLGRQVGYRKLDRDPNNVENIKNDIKTGIKMRYICKKYGCTYGTMNKYIREHNIRVDVMGDMSGSK